NEDVWILRESVHRRLPRALNLEPAGGRTLVRLRAVERPPGGLQERPAAAGDIERREIRPPGLENRLHRNSNRLLLACGRQTAARPQQLPRDVVDSRADGRGREHVEAAERHRRDRHRLVALDHELDAAGLAVALALDERAR